MNNHVLMVVENLPVPFDRRVWNEANALRHAGYDVTVICPTSRQHPESFEVINGIEIHRYVLPAEGKGFLAYANEYLAALRAQFCLSLRIFRKHRFAVIHAANPPDIVFLVALPFKILFGVKFIFDHHDLCPELYIAKFGKKGLPYYILKALEWLTFKTADVVISTNESYAQIARERGGKKAGDIFVVRSGPDLVRVKLCEPDPNHKKGAKYLVGYVGVIGEQEGLDLLCQVISLIVHKGGRNDIHFAVAGDGPALADVKSLAKELNVSDFITFMGRVPDGELFSMLSTADVCINVDQPNEMNNLSTMNKILEYMALGKPVVQFDFLEGRRSAASASLYVEWFNLPAFAEAILNLIDDENLRDEMGRVGLARVQSEFAWPHQVGILQAAYKRLSLSRN